VQNLPHRRRGPVKNSYSTIKLICKVAGIPYGQKVEDGLVPHDLRRTVISFGINEKVVTTEEMRKVIGHANIAMTERYHQMEDAKKRKNSEAIESAYLARLQGAST
jgi:integrase